MGTCNSLQYLIWLNSKAVKIYSIVQSVKLLLALSILPSNPNKVNGLDQLVIVGKSIWLKWVNSNRVKGLNRNNMLMGII